MVVPQVDIEADPERHNVPIHSREGVNDRNVSMAEHQAVFTSLGSKCTESAKIAVLGTVFALTTSVEQSVSNLCTASPKGLQR